MHYIFIASCTMCFSWSVSCFSFQFCLVFFAAINGRTPTNSFWRSCLIRLKRIYNFWCFMLVFAPFALCFVTLRGIFMRFLKLTYWQDATVSVPYFLLFLCFRSDTQEIFSELDKTKARSLIFSGSFPKTEREPEGGRRPPSHIGGTAQALAMPPWCEEPLASP
jgi:hypothetical protein